jgi:outer membrane lipoprotein-sorting protein
MFDADDAHSSFVPLKLMPNQCGGVLVVSNGNKGLKMKACILISGIFLSLQTFSAVAEEAGSVPVDDSYARSIVEKADLVRFPADGFQVDIVINTNQSDKQVETRKYRVLQKGNENTVVMVTEPASERGQIILMKGRDLWVFMPEVSQPVRISLAQRLTGQVANGDLARANFAADYNPKVVRNETINGETYVVMALNAVDRSVTYQKVVYWVNQKNGWPLKAEFYSLSNRLLKKCSYENFQTLAGKTRPTRLVMEDALRSGEKSTLEYSEMKLRELPDKIFTKDYLKKLAE